MRANACARVMRPIAIALVAACSAPAKPTVETTPAVGNLTAPVDTYCPPIHGLGPWHHEVFPSCPAPPITDWLHICEPGDCPTPCAMTSDIADNMGMHTNYSRWVYRYDDRGRWIETSSGDDKPDPADTSTCTYEGDHIAHCSLRGDKAIAERDASGRIVRVTYDEKPEVDTGAPPPPDRLVDTSQQGRTSFDVAYGARGEVIAVGESTLRYDERGRLAGFVIAGKGAPRMTAGDTVLERDASGNVVRETGKFEIRTFTYDADGRRVREAIAKRKPWKLESEEPPKPPGPDAVTTAGAQWSEDDICMDCQDGAVDVVKDPVTERKEQLAWIESSADIHSVGYEGANIVYVRRGARGPSRRVREYSYDCSK
jgi:YD repeat-containing protein